jgi:hypothetical protein
MTQALQEFVDSRGVALRVDRATGVLRGVKLIGLESLNGRRYRPAALAGAIGLYEGAKVNVNHPKDGPLAPRDYRDRLGVIRQVEFRPGEGLFGNLHFNPKHALAEQLAWDAEHNPQNVGFSHNVLARLSRDGEQTVVEAITHVQSVDLVADPAATHGLFEEEVDSSASAASEQERQLREACERADRAERQLRIAELLEAHGAAPAAGRPLAERVGPALFAALLAAEDEGRLETLVAEHVRSQQLAEARRTAADRASRPRSTEQTAALGPRQAPPATAREFARAIRR